MTVCFDFGDNNNVQMFRRTSAVVALQTQQGLSRGRKVLLGKCQAQVQKYSINSLHNTHKELHTYTSTISLR